MACNQRHMRIQRPTTSLVLIGTIVSLALGTAVTEAAQGGRRKKPIQPTFQIDNEGPQIVIRPARLARGHHSRWAGADEPIWFPGRSVIRLDLILPIHHLRLPSRPRPLLSEPRRR